MIKSIQLNFTKIKYAGNSVGRDIRVEVEAFGKFFRVDKRIKAGETKSIDQEILRLETVQDVLQSDLAINVIEKDLLFSDTGSLKSSIKIDVVSEKSQILRFNVEVMESRSLLSKLFWGGRKAIFELEFEAIIGDVERYIPDTKDGWFLTLNNKDGNTSLPEYLKLILRYKKGGREYFMLTEGVNMGELWSVTLKNDGSSYLISDVQHGPMAQATYSISRKILTLNGINYKAADDPKNPWDKGVYDIEIPDYPHGGGLRYSEAKKGTVWFRIGHDDSRYLHPGLVSAGCISIAETERWMEIYSILIKARKGDNRSVGVLKVID
ncbi:MAG: hypothetical protein COV02_00810 [Candidatus Terrybacteria bacterium CG10_big_fil_rev_8_21_14_0_10_41_10]|uniref:Uncharacterized protein n=1 Tax=Candidatus Terrybacteria bacterium CG10_big_fil_rev_8_21_14_0_10_41_10 TaxID=1975026 RepID=A0A2M8LAY3_9BACT|nr:MAG: hypothetical protein COV02_00810 [Candidatus Terrybacteria bacterium CG10_big_fil_rev_8_21_14_0_10_41_10]